MTAPALTPDEQIIADAFFTAPVLAELDFEVAQ